jgi:hypothetical protein
MREASVSVKPLTLYMHEAPAYRYAKSSQAANCSKSVNNSVLPAKGCRIA